MNSIETSYSAKMLLLIAWISFDIPPSLSAMILWGEENKEKIKDDIEGFEDGAGWPVVDDDCLAEFSLDANEYENVYLFAS